MKPSELKRLFAINHHAIHANVKDVSDEEALIQPSPGGNCLNWIVGHIVASRNGILQAMGAEPVWGQEEAARYARSSPPITGADEGKPFGALLQELDRSQERIQSALGAMNETDLAKPYKEEDTLGDRLAFLHFHEAYHVGQTGLSRRILGKEGAIR